MSDYNEELVNYSNEEDNDSYPDEENEGVKHFDFQISTSNIDTLHNKFIKNKLKLDPDFQRHFVWDEKRMDKLIDSIVKNIPFPAIMIARLEDGTHEVIDGQQRLTTIFRFMKNDFTYGKKLFKDFENDKINSFENYPIAVIEMIATRNRDSIYTMFERINTGSVALNSQEVRNSVFRGSYNEFLKELAKNKKFRECIGGNNEKLEKRMEYEEVVLLFFTVYHTFDNGYHKITKQTLTKHMEKNQNCNDVYKTDEKTIFENTFNIIHDVLGETAFAPYTFNDKNEMVKLKSSKYYNKGLFISLVYLFSRNKYDKFNLRKNKDAIKELLIKLCIGDNDFIDATLKGSTLDIKNIKTRTDILEKSFDNFLSLDDETKRCFTYAFKEELYAKSSTCKLCNNKIDDINQAEVDHILAYANGGKTTPENAQLAHYYCNRSKGKK